jgi:uncharacterized RDD family membrane protein YckC
MVLKMLTIGIESYKKEVSRDLCFDSHSGLKLIFLSKNYQGRLPMKIFKRLVRLRKRMADTHFLRRGFAFLFDLIFIGLLSLPLYVVLFWALSLFNPEYQNPIEEIKKVVRLRSEDKKISPLGEMILKGSEKKLEEAVAESKERLEKKELSSEERERLKKKIEESEQKLERIRQERREAGFAQEPEERLAQELKEKTESVVLSFEEHRWVREILVAYIYFTLCFFFGGQTLGKKMLGLKVVTEDGSKLTLWKAFERTHGYAYSLSLLLVGFLQVLWDKRSLTMHDKIAETNVVRLKKKKKKKKKEGEKRIRNTHSSKPGRRSN